MDVRGVALVYFRTRNNKISPSLRPAALSFTTIFRATSFKTLFYCFEHLRIPFGLLLLLRKKAVKVREGILSLNCCCKFDYHNKLNIFATWRFGVNAVNYVCHVLLL
jgi:hypothetical protein